MAFLDEGVLAMSDQSVRRLLHPLGQVAACRECAILMLRHLNKSGGGRPLYRGGGSIAFIGACRSGFLIARDPSDPALRVLAQVKNNLAPPQPSLAYTLTPRPGEPPKLTWLGPVERTAAQLLGGAAMPRGVPRDRARDFLSEFLEDGPRTGQVWHAARERGLSQRTLARAKAELGIRSGRIYQAGEPTTYWLLQHQEVPAPGKPAEDPDTLEPWLAPLRARFPSLTPLEEL
jgi:hypothetical protein